MDVSNRFMARAELLIFWMLLCFSFWKHSLNLGGRAEQGGALLYLFSYLMTTSTDAHHVSFSRLLFTDSFNPLLLVFSPSPSSTLLHPLLGFIDRTPTSEFLPEPHCPLFLLPPPRYLVSSATKQRRQTVFSFLPSKTRIPLMISFLSLSLKSLKLNNKKKNSYSDGHR